MMLANEYKAFYSPYLNTFLKTQRHFDYPSQFVSSFHVFAARVRLQAEKQSKVQLK